MVDAQKIVASAVITIATLSFSFGPSTATRCLLSRLEHHPCTYRHRHDTDMPGQNEMGVYETKYSRGACDILKKNHRVAAIPGVGDSVFYLSSPNKQNAEETNYTRNRLAIYKINCSQNQYIYFELTSMEMEGTTCYDPAVDRDKCVDYIQVRNERNNIISENCGQDVSNLNGSVLPFNYIEVIFRTSPRRGFPGFSATVTCFNPEGCGQTSSSHISSRSLSTSIRQACPEGSFKKITVPYGHDLYYSAHQRLSELVLADREINRTVKIWRVLPWQHLMIFSANGSMKEYRSENRFNSIQSWFPSSLKGPGILHVPLSTSLHRVCYQDYIVDVSNLVPTKYQKKKIHKLNSLLHVLVDDSQSSETQDSQFDNQFTRRKDIVSAMFVKFLGYLQSNLNHKRRWRRPSYAHKSSRTCSPVLQTPHRLLMDAIRASPQ